MARRIFVLCAMFTFLLLPAFGLDDDDSDGNNSMSGGRDAQDIVHFAHDIVVSENQEARDVVCFLCSVKIEGTAHRDVVVFLGSLEVNGKAERDGVVFLGDVSIGENTGIDRDIVVLGGSVHRASHTTPGRDEVVFPFVLAAVPLMLLASFIWLMVWLVRRMRYRYHPYYGMPRP